MFYRNKAHEMVFTQFITNNPCRCPDEYLAAVYLLTADANLWKAARRTIGKKTIDFLLVDIRGVSVNGYTLFRLAQDLYDGTTHITLKDLCDGYLIHDKTFELIRTAMRICREGYAYIGIHKVFN